MAQLASPSPLTAENLKVFSPSLPHNYSASVSSRASEDEDAASLFSDAHSVVSSTSTAPEDEAAPFTVQEASGETVTVYESLDQAVRYSLLRAEQARRQEEETRRFAYMPYSAAPQQSQDVILNEASWVSAPAPPPAGDAQGDADEEDEDAYFSMG
ncbi:hypothetical protein PFICI_06768 [Pestalotiopsis fici W106-1]|uniref:Uncharacterized protein n=1 Tax=Pestalotiopsis fici (strain W106-1 / CGMCC3.15140) TaxID=1229662 RepID=W3X9E0_PESFW|nr:uncharacterized protein PFICI_06768 [Pestalotiopsis fici W106-1]ETS81766.1 hypothetical protein PFICI_06768 [Pestalotiopsis fici W106-1]